MEKKRDYYVILGVNRDAGEAELKSAYRKLVKQYHPDINRDDPDAATKMKELNDAYSILSDPEKRAEYERYDSALYGQSGERKEKNPFSGEFGGNSGIRFDDLFGSTFGGSYSEFFYGRSEKGESKRRQESKNNPVSGSEGSICKRCSGSGLERVTIQSGFGKTTRTRECSVCQGKGKI